VTRGSLQHCKLDRLFLKEAKFVLLDDQDHTADEERILLVGKSRQAGDGASLLASPIREEYEFSPTLQNSYPKQLKTQITIRFDTAAVHFKQTAAELDMSYQNFDCAMQSAR